MRQTIHLPSHPPQSFSFLTAKMKIIPKHSAWQRVGLLRDMRTYKAFLGNSKLFLLTFCRILSLASQKVKIYKELIFFFHWIFVFSKKNISTILVLIANLLHNLLYRRNQGLSFLNTSKEPLNYYQCQWHKFKVRAQHPTIIINSAVYWNPQWNTI